MSGQPTTPHPPQPLQATNLNGSDPTAAQNVSSFNPKEIEKFTLLKIRYFSLYILHNKSKSTVHLHTLKYIICFSLLYSDVNLLSYFSNFFSNTIFTQMQDSCNLFQPPKKTCLPRKNVFTQI
jgi:hypothetical protein